MAPPSSARSRHAAVLLHRRGPGHVVHGAAPGPAGLRRRRVVGDGCRHGARPAPPSPRRPASNSRRLEQPAARLRIGGVGAHGVEALQRHLGRDVGVLGHQRGVVGGVHDQLVRQALGVGEAQAGRRCACVSTPSPSRRSAQKSSASLDPTRETTRWTMPSPACPGAAPGYSKKVRSAPGRALLVRVEEVVDGGVVLVHGLLHQAQSQHPRVEVEVALRVPGDGRDVVDAFELHFALSFRLLRKQL